MFAVFFVSINGESRPRFSMIKSWIFLQSFHLLDLNWRVMMHWTSGTVKAVVTVAHAAKACKSIIEAYFLLAIHSFCFNHIYHRLVVNWRILFVSLHTMTYMFFAAFRTLTWVFAG